MEHQEHGLALGKLLANLQGIELLARTYLYERIDKASGEPLAAFQLNVPIGASQAVNHFNNYDSLSTILRKYNDLNPHAKLDVETIVKLRDGIAHGRIFGEVEDESLRLIKFSKEKSGFVSVTYNEELNSEWFKRNITLTRQIAEQIHLNIMEVQK